MNKITTAFFAGLIGGPIIGGMIAFLLGLKQLPIPTPVYFALWMIGTGVVAYFFFSDKEVKEKVSSTDELVKYAQMLKDGLLTQEEFDKKKQELL